MNPRLFLLPFSLIYASLSSGRNFLFDKNIFKQKKFDKPIILVGNLSVGGTGKTPHVEYLIRLLKSEYKVATLSRGFGRSTSGFVLGGKGTKASSIGDEPMQYLSKFDDVIVAVCEERVEGATKLFAMNSAPDVIIMDDGFQHRKINPGYKILITPYDHLFTQDYLLPAGDLRESRAGYKRADCIVVSKCPPNITDADKEKIYKEINPVNEQHLFFSHIQYTQPVSVSSSNVIPLNDLSKKNILLFTGIANPKLLHDFLKSNSKSFQSVQFPDHHNFTERDIVALKEKFDKFATESSIIITTEKDYQRLKGTPLLNIISDLPCYYIPLEIKIDREQEFNSIIKKYVAENKRNS